MNDTPQLQVENDPEMAQGCLNEALGFGAGLVLPWFSWRFYRRAVRRRLIFAVFFFIFFELAITIFTTIGVGKELFSVTAQVRSVFESGRVPEITIRDGIASVDAPQPFVIFDEQDTAVILDTMGTITELDRTRFTQGFLLTRTSLHLLNKSGRYQELPLSMLHELFGTNPILINAVTAPRYWAGFSAIATILVLVGLVLWNVLGRFIGLLTLGMLLWGLAALVRSGTGFSPVLITGLYAMVPATYLYYLLGLAGVKFFGLHALLLILAWVIALWVGLSGDRDKRIELDPTRDFIQLVIALPVLIAMALNMIFDWNRAALYLWLLAVITLAALVLLEIREAPRPVTVEIPGIPLQDMSEGSNDENQEP
jgi:hypothetical protein